MCFGRAFHLILMHFYILYSMLWGKLSKIRLFSLKAVFLEFRLIQSDFRSIEILFKKFSEPLPCSIDQTCFSINRRSCFRFFKNSVLTDSNNFSKLFSNFSLSLQLGKATQKIFVVCYLIFAKFFSHKAGKTFIPLLLFLFSCFHALFHAFKGYFQTFLNLGFLLIQCYFFEIDHWVLLVYCYIHDCCWLIWSIWGFMKNWKF